jgi:hypothetical protein
LNKSIIESINDNEKNMYRKTRGSAVSEAVFANDFFVEIADGNDTLTTEGALDTLLTWMMWMPALKRMILSAIL